MLSMTISSRHQRYLPSRQVYRHHHPVTSRSRVGIGTHAICMLDSVHYDFAGLTFEICKACLGGHKRRQSDGKLIHFVAARWHVACNKIRRLKQGNFILVILIRMLVRSSAYVDSTSCAFAIRSPPLLLCHVPVAGKMPCLHKRHSVVQVGLARRSTCHSPVGLQISAFGHRMIMKMRLDLSSSEGYIIGAAIFFFAWRADMTGKSM